MKRLNWVLPGVVIFCLAIVLLLGGCVSKSEYEALQAEHATLVEENTSLQAELEGVQSDLTNLQGDHDKLTADYEAVNKELDEIKKVYPPRYFDNYNKLEDWVDEHCPITYGPYNVFKKHLELQQKGKGTWQ